MQKRMVLQIANCIGFIIAMLFNFGAPLLSSSIPSSNEAEVSAEVQSVKILLQPAGYAFSIWGLIYTLVFVFVIY